MGKYELPDSGDEPEAAASGFFLPIQDKYAFIISNWNCYRN
jgi:hypothetical protein